MSKKSRLRSLAVAGQRLAVDSAIEPSGNWRDGLFAIEFYKEGVFLGRQREALAVLRDGVVLGSDHDGGIVEGRMVSSACGGVHCALLLYTLPPGVPLVTGAGVGVREAIVDVAGIFRRDGTDLVGECRIGSDMVEVRFRYVGELPGGAGHVGADKGTNR